MSMCKVNMGGFLKKQVRHNNDFLKDFQHLCKNKILGGPETAVRKFSQKIILIKQSSDFRTNK